MKLHVAHFEAVASVNRKSRHVQPVLRHRIYPDHDFKLIIGSDNWLIFDRWRAFDEIIADFGVVIYPRPGFPLPPDKTLPDNVEIVKAPEIELSSTHIRHCAKKGLDLHFLLPDKVREYIMFNNLYKN